MANFVNGKVQWWDNADNFHLTKWPFMRLVLYLERRDAMSHPRSALSGGPRRCIVTLPVHDATLALSWIMECTRTVWVVEQAGTSQRIFR